MSILGSVLSVLSGLTSVFGATKRLVQAAKESVRPKAPSIVVPPPIREDRYTRGLFDGIDRERGKRLEQEMTERARKRLADEEN